MGDIRAGEAAILVPGEEQENEGEHDDGAFGEQGEEEQGEGGEGEREFLRLAGVEVGQETGEHEKQGEGVFSFGDPGDGFGVDGVNDEEDGGEESAGNSEGAEDLPEEDAGAAVEDGVEQVVGRSCGSPEFPFEPEGGGDEGNVVDIFGGEPDVVEGGMDDVAVEDEGVVVPEEAAAKDDGGKGGEGKGHEQAAP